MGSIANKTKSSRSATTGSGSTDRNKDIRSRVLQYLSGIAGYLTQYRKREGLTQNEMAKKLDISLNRYREYEQNTTDNAKGVPLDLLLRICDLEGIAVPAFVASMENVTLQSMGQMDSFEEKLLKQFRNVPLSERKRFVEAFDFDDETDKLIPNQMRWFVRIFNQLVRLPYGQRMKIEREVLEAFMAHTQVQPGTEEHNQLLGRLRTLLRYYFSNFEEAGRE